MKQMVNSAGLGGRMARITVFTVCALLLVANHANAQVRDAASEGTVVQPNPVPPALVPGPDGRMVPKAGTPPEPSERARPALIPGPGGRMLPAPSAPPKTTEAAAPALMLGPDGRMRPAPSAPPKTAEAPAPALIPGPDGRMLPMPSRAQVVSPDAVAPRLP
jgi:hypothetical protein